MSGGANVKLVNAKIQVTDKDFRSFLQKDIEMYVKRVTYDLTGRMQMLERHNKIIATHLIGLERAVRGWSGKLPHHSGGTFRDAIAAVSMSPSPTTPLASKDGKSPTTKPESFGQTFRRVKKSLTPTPRKR